jgi:hypothetical protein
MADTNDPQPAYRITYLLAATKVAQEWAPDSLSRSKAYQILIHRRNGTLAPKLVVPRISALEVRSPDNFQPAITPENFVGGYYRYVLRYCLGDDLPIKCVSSSTRMGASNDPQECLNFLVRHRDVTNHG